MQKKKKISRTILLSRDKAYSRGVYSDIKARVLTWVGCCLTRSCYFQKFSIDSKTRH